MLAHKYTLTADIPNAFGQLSDCSALPLPAQVIENVILAKNLNFTLGTTKGVNAEIFQSLKGDPQYGENENPPSGSQHTLGNPPTESIQGFLSMSFSLSSFDICDEASVFFAEPLTAVRLGVPQGSATSSAVIERLLAPVLEKLPAITNYADDFALFGDSEAEVMTRLQNLESELSSLLTGLPQLSKLRQHTDRIVFLGYELTNLGGHIQIRLPKEKWMGFLKEFHKRRSQAMKCLPIERGLRLKLLRQYLTNFFSARPMWSEAEQQKAKLAQLIAPSTGI
jgi:hypothetical protein